MNNTFYLSIAGFIYQIEFQDTEYVFYKKKWISDFKSFFKLFIIDGPKNKIDHTIQFIDKRAYQLFENKNIRLMGYLEKNSPSKSTTYYSIGIMQFEAILMGITEKLIAKRGGFFFHASAIFINDGAILSTGDSGSGKSTVARLVKNTYPTIADDFTIINKEKSHYLLYQVPRHEKIRLQKRYGKLPIHAIFFLKKDIRTHLQKITSTLEIMERMKGQVFILEETLKKRIMKNYLTFIRRYNKTYLLSFTKNKNQLNRCIKELF